MKNIFTLLFIAVLLPGKGQEKKDDITKKDAIEFIQKFYRDYAKLVPRPFDNYNSQGLHEYKAELDGCNLVIRSKRMAYRYSSNKFYKKIVIIPLNKVYLDGATIKSFEKVIKQEDYETYPQSIAKDRGYLKPAISNMNNCTLLSIENDGFKEFDNNIDVRVLNAVKFLIEKCGGGKRANSDEKF